MTMKDEAKKSYGPFIGMLAYSPEKITEITTFEVAEMGSELNDASDNIILCNGMRLLLFGFCLKSLFAVWDSSFWFFSHAPVIMFTASTIS